MTDDILRGQRAKSILEDSLMIEAQEHIEAEFWRLFKTLAPADIDGLQKLKGMQYLHEKYLAYLRSVINNGKLAQLDLDRVQTRPRGY